MSSAQHLAVVMQRPLHPAATRPPERRRCADCPALLRGGPTQPATARCAEATSRLIGWAWNGADQAPHWCPRESRA